MDAKKARETLTRLCAEWDRTGGLSGQLMNRYIRPAGFSLALGAGVAGGAGCSSSGSSDALPPAQDSAREALPAMIDVYGVLDGVAVPLDGARETVPPAADVYGITIVDGRVAILDGAREALPPAPDVYGVFDAPVPRDGGVDAYGVSVDSARETLPPAQDAYGVFDAPIPRDGGVDGPAVDALPSAADAADGDSAEDGGDSGAGD
jgi:hypothetical protein